MPKAIATFRRTQVAAPAVVQGAPPASASRTTGVTSPNNPPQKRSATLLAKQPPGSTKHKVTDEALAEFARRISTGLPSGKLFPARMSDCEFTPAQREIIYKARIQRKALRNNQKAEAASATPVVPPINRPPVVTEAPPQAQTPKAMSRLQKLIYLQSGKCFFCGEVLDEEDANIEHLNPKSHGGTNASGNVVACHKSLNQTFGDMDLKQKFEFVLKSAGSFKCPTC